MQGQQQQEPEPFLRNPNLDYSKDATDEKEDIEEEDDEENSTKDDEHSSIAPIGSVDQQRPFAPGQAPSAGSNDQTTQIILFSLEAITAALLIIYLIMSGFNKKSFKETLSNSDKALVYILGSIVLAAAFVGADILIANTINGQQGSNQPQMPNQGMSQPSRPGNFGKPKLNQRQPRTPRPNKTY
jgi:hypothetical protein